MLAHAGLLLGLVLLTGSAFGSQIVAEPHPQGDPPAHARVLSTEPEGTESTMPSRVRMVRALSPPLVDGHLDESVWSSAAVLPPLTNVDPRDDRELPRTEVLLLYDDNFLYIGVRAFDEPDKILAWEMRRDGDMKSDDRLELVIDSFHDRRNAYRFRINPLGARGDGLVEGGRNLGDDWDGIWLGRTSVNHNGWVAEIAIPFKTLSFDPRNPDWGFNIERVIRRDNQSLRWTAARQDRDLDDLAQAGTLEGLTGLRQGRGLDIKPTGVARYRFGEWQEPVEFIPSFDAFYRVTPSLTAALTVNTDFAETEVDEREINFDRFSQFFPEKRDFFLQDAGIFEFGELQRNGRPFFSRRIGLDDEGETVDILAGGKITGRVGPVSIGLLDVQTDSKGDLSSRNLFAGRATYDILDQSRVGVIVTNGNPTGDESNSVVGTDLFLRTDSLFGDKTLNGGAWLLRSFTGDSDGRDWSYGGRVEFPNEPIDFSLAFTEIQQNFRPALGFVNRRGIRQYEASTRYRKRYHPRQFVRQIMTGASFEVVTDDVDNRLQSASSRIDLFNISSRNDDSIKLSYRLSEERLEEDERIAGRLNVPAGTYRDHQVSLGVETSSARPLSGSLEVNHGDFYQGTRWTIKPQVLWQPSHHFFLNVAHEASLIEMPDQELDAHLTSVRTGIMITPDLSLTAIVQYDTLSKELGLFGRLHWTIEDGKDFFVVVNSSFEEDEEDGKLGLHRGELVAKLGWTFRF